MRTTSISGELKVYSIVDPKGVIRCLTMDPTKVWDHFFTYPLERRCCAPLYEAIKAYEAIGYRMQEFQLVPIETKIKDNTEEVEEDYNWADPEMP